MKEYNKTRKDFYSQCDGLVKTYSDASKAVKYYKAFYNKLEEEGKLTDKIKAGFNKTIEKYKALEYQKLKYDPTIPKRTGPYAKFPKELMNKDFSVGEPDKGFDVEVIDGINYCRYDWGWDKFNKTYKE